MAEPRGSLRLGAVLALAVIALFEVLALVHGIRSQRRLRARVSETQDQRVAAVRPSLEPVLARQAWDEGAALALSLGLASEVEVIDREGRVVFSRPSVAPVTHRLRSAELQQLAVGRSRTAVARDGTSVRVLTYLPLPATTGGYVLRLAALAPDLEDEVREWQAVVLGHMVALSALGLAATLVLWPASGARPAAPPGALSAYEEAMGRLRERGEALSARYEEETRRMEGRIREQDAMARAGELTAGMVHEVRNGLGTIVGYARLLERGEDRSGAPARAILDECATLETVVRRFNDFVKLERLRLAPVDLRPLASRVVAREQHGHDDVDVQLLGFDEALVVPVDEELIERALENVVRNALEAAASGGRHVVLRAERGEGHVLLHVEDDGPGFAADHPGVVRPFYSTRPGGLGLGLPLARKIVVLHGGELVLERRVAGARVTLRLPDAATGALEA